MGMGSRPCSEDCPSRIIVHNCAMTMDGGTIHLIATDDTGEPVNIMLATTLPTGSGIVTGRLYFNGVLVPMRSEREAQVLKLLSEAAVQAPDSKSTHPRMATIGDDIKEFFAQTPAENCSSFIRKIIESVQPENYLRYTTDDEKALIEESNRDEWERRSGKKKRRPWQRGS